MALVRRDLFFFFSHSMKGLSESNGASQIELLVIGNTNNASLQRGEISRWHRKAGARRAQCQAKKTGKIEEKVRKCNRAHRKEEEKNSAVLQTMWMQKAMVPREVRAHCSIVRLEKRREGLGEQSLADLTNLPLTG